MEGYWKVGDLKWSAKKANHVGNLHEIRECGANSGTVQRFFELADADLAAFVVAGLECPQWLGGRWWGSW